jgi:hypothetical protein
MLTGDCLAFWTRGRMKLALGDEQGRPVDADGENVFGCACRTEHLTGAGTIGARAVKCIRRIRTSKRSVQSSALKRRKSTEITGASDRPIVGSHDSVSVSHRPFAALMSVDAKTYVARPAQARLTKTGRLARTASAQKPRAACVAPVTMSARKTAIGNRRVEPSIFSPRPLASSPGPSVHRARAAPAHRRECQVADPATRQNAHPPT